MEGIHSARSSSNVRRSAPAIAALAAALTLAACGGGETAAGGATSSSDSTADCEGITAAITDTLTRALDATVEVSLDLDHCEADGLGRWAAVDDSFFVRVTPSAAPTAEELVALVDAAAEAWALPEVQAVAPKTPELHLDALALDLRLEDGFAPLDPEVAEHLAAMAADPVHSYMFVARPNPDEGSGEPGSSVQLVAGGSLDDDGLQTSIEEGWEPVAAVAELTGYRSIVMVALSGGGSSIDVSMPATPYPDLVQFTRDLAAFAADADLEMRLSGTWYPTSLLGTAYRDVSVDELTAAQQDELDRLVDVVEAWGLGPVSVTIQPVYE